MTIPKRKSVVSNTLISSKIYFICETRIMLDADLAILWGEYIQFEQGCS